MRLLVLGGGVVGVAAAWYLVADGHDVTLVDRQPGVARETSFANGGQISASHAEPWANPGAPRQILSWLGREDAPLLFRLRADPRQWRWALQFLLECLPSRTRRNTIECVNLAMYSRDCLKALRETTGIRYDEVARGRGGRNPARAHVRRGESIREHRGGRLRRRARQLQSVPGRAARRPVQCVSGQGLLGDDRCRRPPGCADVVVDRSRIEDRDDAAGRPLARRRHGRARGLGYDTEPHALRGARAA